MRKDRALEPWSDYLTGLKTAIREGTLEDDEVFDSLARQLFSLQCREGTLGQAPGFGGNRLPAHWTDVPPLPQYAFKVRHMGLLDERIEPDALFKTSGTSADVRGLHPVYDLSWYRTISTAGMRRALYPEWEPGHEYILALLPSAEESPESSLSRMALFAMEEFPGGRHVWGMKEGDLLYERCLDWFRFVCEQGVPALVMGTSFAWVHLLDEMRVRGHRFTLPPGSRIMETGGFKGRSREVSPEELHGWMVTSLGIPEREIINEYGMTELMSQLYSDGEASDGRLRPPPWVRVLAIDPTTGVPQPSGTIGVLTLFDLANLTSCVALKTLDLGWVNADGSVCLQGRAGTVSPRGCSLPMEESMPEMPIVREHHPGVIQAERWLEEWNETPRFPEERTVGECVRAMVSVLDTLSVAVTHEDAHFRSSLASALLVSDRTFMEGMSAGTRYWTEAEFLELARVELALNPEDPLPCHDRRPILVIAASTVPTAMVFDVLMAWFSGRPVLVKVPASLKDFAERLETVIEAVAPEFSECIYLSDWPGMLGVGMKRLNSLCHSVVVNGSDSTVAEIREEVASGTQVIAHGSRQSLAILPWEELRKPEARTRLFEGLARDVLLWNQKGCLSPNQVVLEVPDPSNLPHLLGELDQALSTLRAVWGPSPSTLECQVQWMDLKDRERFHEQLSSRTFENLCLEASWNGTTVLTEGGHLMIRRVTDLKVEPWPVYSPPLSTIVAPASIHTADWLLELLQHGGASRLVEPGDAQSPRVHWQHDGYDVLRPFAGAFEGIKKS